MKDFLEAVTIMSQYTDKEYIIHCEHDYLYFNIGWKSIKKKDRKRLEELGFFKDEEYDGDGIGSFKYGSC